MFHIVCLNYLFLHDTQHHFGLNFLFHPLSLAFLLQTVHTFFCFLHSSFFSLIPLCLNPFLFTILLYSVVSAAFKPSINGSTEFLTYYLKFSSILIHPSQLINPIPPISMLRYALSPSFLKCSVTCIAINFLVLPSKLFNSPVFYFRIPATYLITQTAQVLTAIILFLPFNFDLNISLNRRRYSLLNVCFISFSLMLSVSNISKYV